MEQRIKEHLSPLIDVNGLQILGEVVDFRGIDGIEVRKELPVANDEAERKKNGNERKEELNKLKSICCEMVKQYKRNCDSYNMFDQASQLARMNIDCCIAYALRANTDSGIACMCCHRLFDDHVKAHNSHLISKGYLKRIGHHRGFVVKGDKITSVVQGESSDAFKVELQCKQCDNDGQSPFENILEVLNDLAQLTLQEALDCKKFLQIRKSSQLYKFIVINIFRNMIASTDPKTCTNFWKIADTMRQHILVWRKGAEDREGIEALNVYAVPSHRSTQIHLNSKMSSPETFRPMRGWSFAAINFNRTGVLALFPPFAVVISLGDDTIPYLEDFRICDRDVAVSLRMIHSASDLSVEGDLILLFLCAYTLATKIPQIVASMPELPAITQEIFRAPDGAQGIKVLFANKYDKYYSTVVHVAKGSCSSKYLGTLESMSMSEVMLFLRYFYINHPNDLCLGYFEQVRNMTAIAFTKVRRRDVFTAVCQHQPNETDSVEQEYGDVNASEDAKVEEPNDATSTSDVEQEEALDA